MRSQSKNASVILLVLPVLLGRSAFAQRADESPQPPKVEQGVAAPLDVGPYPQPGPGYVTDLAGLLNREQAEQIEQWLWQVEANTGVEIAVVTIQALANYPNAANGSIEAFATGLFNAYGVGNLPENDGVLLVVSSGDRKARIELGKKYAHVRDGDAQRIMDRVIIPEFKAGKFADGVTNGVRALMLEFAGIRIGTNWKLIGMIAAVPILGLIAFSLFKNGKRGWGWVVVGAIVILLLAILRVVHAVAESSASGSSDSWSSGGFGGGFGGGSSGGGGASGSW